MAKRHHHRRLWVLLAAVSIIFSACGGDSSDSDDSGDAGSDSGSASSGSDSSSDSGSSDDSNDSSSDSSSSIISETKAGVTTTTGRTDSSRENSAGELIGRTVERHRRWHTHLAAPAEPVVQENEAHHRLDHGNSPRQDAGIVTPTRLDRGFFAGGIDGGIRNQSAMQMPLQIIEYGCEVQTRAGSAFTR